MNAFDRVITLDRAENGGNTGNLNSGSSKCEECEIKIDRINNCPCQRDDVEPGNPTIRCFSYNNLHRITPYYTVFGQC